MALAMQIFRLAGDIAGFLLGVPHPLNLDLLALVAFGPQRLAQPSLVGGDQARGRAQYHRRRTVIALPPYPPRAGKIALEAQDVFHLRPAPAIDALIVIADHTDIAALARQQFQPEILDDIGVLI